MFTACGWLHHSYVILLFCNSISRTFHDRLRYLCATLSVLFHSRLTTRHRSGFTNLGGSLLSSNFYAFSIAALIFATLSLHFSFWQVIVFFEAAFRTASLLTLYVRNLSDCRSLTIFKAFHFNIYASVSVVHQSICFHAFFCISDRLLQNTLSRGMPFYWSASSNLRVSVPMYCVFIDSSIGNASILFRLLKDCSAISSSSISGFSHMSDFLKKLTFFKSFFRSNSWSTFCFTGFYWFLPFFFFLL